jgi:Protein of unknown function (DUF1266)
MNTSSRIFVSALSPLILLLTLNASSTVCAQDVRGTVKSDSLQVYSEMSADSESVTTLTHGTVVRINISVTNGEGSWCAVSSIDAPAKLGFVRCDGLERQNAPSTAASAGGGATQAWNSGSQTPSRAQKAWAIAASAILAGFNREPTNTLAAGGLTEEQKIRTRRLLEEWWGIGNRDDLFGALSWIEQGGHRQVFSALGARASQLGPEDLKKVVGRLNSEDANSVLVARRYYEKLGGQSITGWDFGRYINLCRWGVQVGYLSEEEAWPRVMYAAIILQQSFGSWQEFGENYLIGREFWSLRQTQKDGPAMRASYLRLLNDPSSPWNRIPWGLGLQ